MAKSSILGGERAPLTPSGKDIDALGPSDNSDSGSDVQAIPGRGNAESDGDLPGEHGSTGDSVGTGERASVESGEDRAGLDISPDHITGGRRSRALGSLDDLATEDDDAS